MRTQTSSPWAPRVDRTACSLILYWRLERKKVLCPSLHLWAKSGKLPALVHQVFLGHSHPHLLRRHLQQLSCCEGSVERSQQWARSLKYYCLSFSRKSLPTLCTRKVYLKYVKRWWVFADEKFLKLTVSLDVQRQSEPLSWCTLMSGFSPLTTKEPNQPQTNAYFVQSPAGGTPFPPRYPGDPNPSLAWPLTGLFTNLHCRQNGPGSCLWAFAHPFCHQPISHVQFLFIIQGTKQIPPPPGNIPGSPSWDL